MDHVFFRPRDQVRAAGLLAGYAADRLFGDPRRAHPVAWFGNLASAVERRIWADSRPRGVVHLLICTATATGLGVAAERVPPPLRFLATATATWIVLGGRGLASEGIAMADLIEAEDLAGARARLSHLCGRDAAALDLADLTRAATESIAENTSDAVVAPLFWGAVAGVPGLLAYRALNTLDAMVGHRSPRYERFGWASARADDVANLVPSRLAALFTAACAGRDARRVLKVWRRDANVHPSPNAGQVEAAFAGALGVRLGGVNSYGGEVSERGRLGDGDPPRPADLRRAVRLSLAVGALAAVAAAVVSR
ncbi:cobalamin biosynthesis protein [Amycolatopsis magusensis]|uniref:Cobalamin biosynthesis protein CobD n=1 Tax=Amycolatopsis magusensis TaxID=882444 RepID=A0ABS4PRG6_9PSEU|nr:cobalamin biosynthesis protein [Amycolatopsis magusensis]MBP2182028.1 adenosylcobinamide-phosphate synthase [Amycolatopsis magusensis]